MSKDKASKLEKELQDILNVYANDFNEWYEGKLPFELRVKLQGEAIKKIKKLFAENNQPQEKDGLLDGWLVPVSKLEVGDLLCRVYPGPSYNNAPGLVRTYHITNVTATTFTSESNVYTKKRAEEENWVFVRKIDYSRSSLPWEVEGRPSEEVPPSDQGGEEKECDCPYHKSKYHLEGSYCCHLWRQGALERVSKVKECPHSVTWQNKCWGCGKYVDRSKPSPVSKEQPKIKKLDNTKFWEQYDEYKFADLEYTINLVIDRVNELSREVKEKE